MEFDPGTLCPPMAYWVKKALSNKLLFKKAFPFIVLTNKWEQIDDD